LPSNKHILTIINCVFIRNNQFVLTSSVIWLCLWGGYIETYFSKTFGLYHKHLSAVAARVYLHKCTCTTYPNSRKIENINHNNATNYLALLKLFLKIKKTLIQNIMNII